MHVEIRIICQSFLPEFNCNRNVSSDFSKDNKHEFHELTSGGSCAVLCGQTGRG